MLHKSNIIMRQESSDILNNNNKGRAQSLGELSRRTFHHLMRRSSAEEQCNKKEDTNEKKCGYPYLTISKQELVSIMKDPTVIIIDTREAGPTNNPVPRTYH
jgi:hypothetical protein